MLQTAPMRCLRAAARPLSFTSHNQSIMIRVTYAAHLQRAVPTTTRRLSTRVLRAANPHARQQPHKPVTAVEYCLSKRSKPLTTVFARRNATTAASPSASPASTSKTTLTWNNFLALRKTRRRINLVCSLGTAACATMGGIMYLSQTDFDQWAARTTGMDPFIVLGLSTFGFMGVGWLLGPVVGAPVFNMIYRGVIPEFRAVRYPIIFCAIMLCLADADLSCTERIRLL